MKCNASLSNSNIYYEYVWIKFGKKKKDILFDIKCMYKCTYILLSSILAEFTCTLYIVLVYNKNK